MSEFKNFLDYLIHINKQEKNRFDDFIKYEYRDIDGYAQKLPHQTDKEGFYSIPKKRLNFLFKKNNLSFNNFKNDIENIKLDKKNYYVKTKNVKILTVPKEKLDEKLQKKNKTLNDFKNIINFEEIKKNGKKYYQIIILKN